MPVPAIVANTIIVPLVLRFGYGVNLPFILLVLSIAAGEFLSCFVLGELLAKVLSPIREMLFGEDSMAI